MTVLTEYRGEHNAHILAVIERAKEQIQAIIDQQVAKWAAEDGALRPSNRTLMTRQFQLQEIVLYYSKPLVDLHHLLSPTVFCFRDDEEKL